MPEIKTEPVEESKTISLLNQILSYKGLIIGLAAIITAAASWFKPPDVTATKATYEVLSIKVNELTKTTEALTKEIQESHQDVSSLKSYIDGFNNGRLSNLSDNDQVIEYPPPPPPPGVKGAGDVSKPSKTAAPAPVLPPFEKVIKDSSDMAF